jgi:hypothetical protein
MQIETEGSLDKRGTEVSEKFFIKNQDKYFSERTAINSKKMKTD